MPRLTKNRNNSPKRDGKATRTLVLAVVMLSLLLTASAISIKVDLAKNASINITRAIFEQSGNATDYSVQVKNEGEILLRNVLVTETLPPGVTYSKLKSSNPIPLLKCIGNNLNGSTKSLIWYLDSIGSGQERWINFTIRKNNILVNLSQLEVRAEGMALGYNVEGSPLLGAVPSAPQEAPGKEISTNDILSSNLGDAIRTGLELEENMSLAHTGLGMNNVSDLGH